MQMYRLLQVCSCKLRSLDLHNWYLPSPSLKCRISGNDPDLLNQNLHLNHLVVQSLSHFRLFATPWTAARQASLTFTISQSLLKLLSIESVMLSNVLILFSSCPQSFSESGSFPGSRLFTLDGQSIGASANLSPRQSTCMDWELQRMESYHVL